MRIAIAFTVALALVACADQDHDGHDHGHDHAHDAPHGGHLIELGDHAAHIEVKIDHDAGTVSLWVLGEDMKAGKADAAPTLRFLADGSPVQVKATGNGGAWTFTHEGLKGEPENARFEIKVGGKTYTPEWHHHHDDDDHDHEEDHDEEDGHDHDDDHG